MAKPVEEPQKWRFNIYYIKRRSKEVMLRTEYITRKMLKADFEKSMKREVKKVIAKTKGKDVCWEIIR